MTLLASIWRFHTLNYLWLWGKKKKPLQFPVTRKIDRDTQKTPDWELRALAWVWFWCLWDRLRPGALDWRVCTWTNISLSNRIQRCYNRLKINVCVASWDRLWKRYKKAKTQLSFLRCLEQKEGSCAWSPAQSITGGWADHPSHSSSPNHGSTPTLTPFKGPAGPSLRVSKRTCYLFSFHHVAAGVETTPFPNFSSGLFSISTH